MNFVLQLPWPDRRLSPNARVHWAVKAKAVKAARGGAAIGTTASGILRSAMMPVIKLMGAEINYTFCPPDARRRDLDNLIACTKAYTDGIASALGVDDSTFSLRYGMGDMTVKGGAVMARIGVKA